jgi:hypothetical protein
MVFFKHQYITNPTISPESHVVAEAQQLATALKGNIPAGNETAEATEESQQTVHKKLRRQSKTTQGQRNNAIGSGPTQKQG